MCPSYPWFHLVKFKLSYAPLTNIKGHTNSLPRKGNNLWTTLFKSKKHWPQHAQLIKHAQLINQFSECKTTIRIRNQSFWHQLDWWNIHLGHKRGKNRKLHQNTLILSMVLHLPPHSPPPPKKNNKNTQKTPLVLSLKNQTFMTLNMKPEDRFHYISVKKKNKQEEGETIQCEATIPLLFTVIPTNLWIVLQKDIS